MLYDELRKKLNAYPARDVVAPDRIPASVLVPFFDKDGAPHVLFTVRSRTLQYHKGEISFPGGAQEPNEDSRTTALRELYEEITVAEDSVEILGRLDMIRTVSSSFLVVPYVGYLKPGTTFHPNEEEVAEILEVPFEHFLNPEIFREEMRVVDQRSIPVYYYQWKNHSIWGLTARILKCVIDLLGVEK